MVVYLWYTLTSGLLEFLPWTVLSPADQPYVREEWWRRIWWKNGGICNPGIKISSSLTSLWIQLCHIQTSQQHRSGNDHVLPLLELQAQTLTPSSERRAHISTRLNAHACVAAQNIYPHAQSAVQTPGHTEGEICWYYRSRWQYCWYTTHKVSLNLN